MNGVVVDTDVVSYLFKDHPLASRYDGDLLGRTVVICCMTLAELDRWAIQARWSLPDKKPIASPTVVIPSGREESALTRIAGPCP